MNLFKLETNRGLVLAWFISYMLILFFTVFVNFIAYFRIEEQIVEQNNHYVTELLRNRKEELDNLQQLVSNIAMELTHDEAVNQLAFSTDSIQGGNFYRVIKATEAISKYRTIEGDFSNIYVYFHKLDYCVGMDSSNEAASYFRVNFGDRKIQCSEWLSMIRKNHPGDFVYLDSIDNEMSKTVSYIRSVYGTERFTPYATIVIEMESERFLPVPSKQESYNDFFYIADKENQVLPFGDAAMNAKVQEIVRQYGIRDGISTVGKQIMIAERSENSDWTYLYLVDKTVFQRSIYVARSQIVLFNLLGIGAMVFVAFLFTRRNYKPVQKILNIFGKTDGIPKSEFRYIESRISDMVAENQAYSKITEKLQDNVIRSAFLSRLLKECAPISNKEEILESLGFTFSRHLFTVVLFYIEINDEMFFDHQNDNTEEAYRLARLVLTNVLDDLLAEKEIITEYCDVDGMLACIVNLDEIECVDVFSKTVRKLQKFLLNNFNIRFMAGLSNSYPGLDDLPKCYSEAMSCVEQYFFSGNDVVTYSELEHTELADCYISKALEEQLVNGMKVGNYEACIRVLDQIFANNILGSGKSIQAVKFILYELTAIMIKTIAEIGEIDDDSEIAELLSMVDNIGVNTDMNEINYQLQSVIQSFCAKNVQRTVQKTDLLSERAKQFVDEHYMDSALTVAVIAESCNVSMAYLSTSFKKKYQNGLLEYINLVRIEHAKTILEQTNDTVERVAELVGYGNLRSFFRMFSRYVGTTPNRYRAMMLAKRKESAYE